MKISVVVPAYNEESNVENFVKLLLKNLSKEIHEIIIVNDCSNDQTKDILNKISKHDLRIRPIHRTEDRGVGNAIKAGLAAISPKSDYTLLLDCDFIANKNDIKKIIKKNYNVDGIIGSRYMQKGCLKNYPFIKKVANRIFHKLIRLSLGIKHCDISNNFKLYKSEVIRSIYPLLKSKGFSINAETGIYPILLGYRIKEVPVIWVGRSKGMGKSSFNVLKAGPGYIRVLFNLLKFKYFSKSLDGNTSLQKTEAKHFNDLVKRSGETYYGNLKPIASVRFSRKAKTILSYLKRVKNPSVLEIGCGTGILSKYILEKKPTLHIEGVDISSEAIKVAKKTLKKYPHAHFQHGDTLNLPFRDNYFDFVIGNSILHHLPTDKALREINRILKPHGMIWFCEPNILNPQIAIEKNFPIIKSLLQDSPNERAFSRWGIKKELERNGFDKVDTAPYEFLHPIIPSAAFVVLIPLCLLLEKIPIIKEFAGTVEIRGRVIKNNVTRINNSNNGS